MIHCLILDVNCIYSLQKIFVSDLYGQECRHSCGLLERYVEAVDFK